MSGPVLIVDDDDVQLELLASMLRRKLDYGSLKAANGREALKILEGDKDRAIRLAILDLNMPVMGGLETLEIIRRQYPDIPIIMLTGSRDIDDAVRALKAGATDFLSKPYQVERMIVTVRNALKIGALASELSRLKSEKENAYGFGNLIGHDAGLSAAVAAGRRAAASDIPVLITGETGVGKDVFAQALHGEGARAGKPFIAVNCGAIPSQLAESALFGHEKGAFTGATEKTAGKFREADGGTIFLDEVGELPLDVQVKLLRVLQQKEVEPVGSAKSLPVNVRVISATNRDLEADVKSGRFREDLFFRLNVLQIRLPPLRERKQDIPVLARHFIERFCAEEARDFRDISQNALRKLCAQDWPGNIREMRNVIHRAMVMSEGGIEEDDLSLSPEAELAKIARDEKALSLSFVKESGQLKTLHEIEIEMMAQALEKFGGNITESARALGIAKSTFYRKIKDCGLADGII